MTYYRNISPRHRHLEDKITTNDGNEFIRLDNTIKLNIDELHEVATYRSRETDELVVICDPKTRHMKRCPYCHEPGLYRSGYTSDDRFVTDVPYGSTLVHLQVSVPRYSCKRCGKRVSHRFKSFNEKERLSYRLIDDIKRRVRNPTETFVHIAKSTGVSVGTVGNIARDLLKELDDARGKPTTSRALGIDEKHYNHKQDSLAKTQGCMYLVLVDVENGTPIEIGRNNRKTDVKKAIRGLENPKDIEVICTDLAPGYKSVVEELVKDGVLRKDVKVVPDHFHIKQDLIRYVMKSRKLILQYLKEWIETVDDEQQREEMRSLYSRVAKNPYLFKHSPRNLAKDRNRINLMMKAAAKFDEFKILRDIKDRFFDIYELDDPDDVKEALNEWLNYVKACDPALFGPMQTFAGTVTKWKKEIINYFDEHKKYSNAITEAQNSVIQSIQMEGRGYSYEMLRLKLLYGQAPSKRPTPQKSTLF